MPDDHSSEAGYILIEDVQRAAGKAGRQSRFEATDDVVDPWSYQAKRGQGTLRLNLVEYRILRFLASRPNRAFSGRRIAAAVSTKLHPVTVPALGRYIRSLRAQLGFFSDYIQTVPFIGYRFKA
jgi:DNA-binding response OmpR family regulator